MRSEEYGLMFRAEEAHWWYQGLRAMLAAHCPAEAGRVLDAGCGTGANLARLDTPGIGLDYAPAALGYCRQRTLHRLVRGSIEALPFADASFDTIFLLDVLYHRGVRDPGGALREANRVLRSGGCVCINLPAYAWLTSSHDDAVHTARRFTRGATVRLLESAGFKVEHATYWNTFLFPAAVAVRLCRKWRPPQVSDLETLPSPWLSAVCTGLLAMERHLQRLAPLPFGLSVFVLAGRRKRSLDT